MRKLFCILTAVLLSLCVGMPALAALPYDPTAIEWLDTTIYENREISPGEGAGLVGQAVERYEATPEEERGNCVTLKLNGTKKLSWPTIRAMQEAAGNTPVKLALREITEDGTVVTSQLVVPLEALLGEIKYNLEPGAIPAGTDEYGKFPDEFEVVRCAYGIVVSGSVRGGTNISIAWRANTPLTLGEQAVVEIRDRYARVMTGYEASASADGLYWMMETQWPMRSGSYSGERFAPHWMVIYVEDLLNPAKSPREEEAGPIAGAQQ